MLRDFISRQSRGLGLPEQGWPVIEPTSIKPKPRLGAISVSSAFLSKPAAKPTGFLKNMPPIFCSSIGSEKFRESEMVFLNKILLPKNFPSRIIRSEEHT